MNQEGASVPVYRRSSWLILHIANPLARFFVGRLGLGTSGGIRILEVKGRKSGKWYAMPIRLLELNDNKYLVALQGKTFWVRNLRAQGDGRLRVGGKVTEFRAVELPNQEKLPILRAYLKRWWSVSKSLTTIKSPEAPDEEFMKAAPSHPVFQIK